MRTISKTPYILLQVLLTYLRVSVNEMNPMLKISIYLQRTFSAETCLFVQLRN
jgi:hypothetical protein